MREKEQILILRRIPHKDNTYVLDTLARGGGRKSFILRTGRTAQGKRNRSLSVPMQFLEVEWVGRSRWPRIVRMTPEMIYTDLFMDLRKNAQGYFMLENIRQLIYDNEDSEWYDWLAEEFRRLDREPFSADFPLFFLAGLMERLGIAPAAGQFGMFFDASNGVFISSPDMYTWDARKSGLFKKFLNQEPLSGAGERREVYTLVEQYLQHHFPAYRLPATLKWYQKMAEE